MADRETDLRNLKAIKSKLEKIKELERKIESAKASIRNEEKKIEDVDVPKGKTDNEKSTRERIEGRRKNKVSTVTKCLIAITFIAYVISGAIAIYQAYNFLIAHLGVYELLGTAIDKSDSVTLCAVGMGFSYLVVFFIAASILYLGREMFETESYTCNGEKK